MSSTSTTTSTCASGTVSTLKSWSAEIEDVKAVPCTTEHGLELFYVGAMGKAAARPRTRSRTTWSSTATPRSVPTSARR